MDIIDSIAARSKTIWQRYWVFLNKSGNSLGCYPESECLNQFVPSARFHGAFLYVGWRIQAKVCWMRISSFLKPGLTVLCICLLLITGEVIPLNSQYSERFITMLNGLWPVVRYRIVELDSPEHFFVHYSLRFDRSQKYSFVTCPSRTRM